MEYNHNSMKNKPMEHNKPPKKLRDFSEKELQATAKATKAADVDKAVRKALKIIKEATRKSLESASGGHLPRGKE